MKKVFLLLFGFCCCVMLAQEERISAYPEIDSLYREDQFYIGATFHIIGDRPSGITQSGFSGGLHAGFIRDIPFNKRRNWALGLGIGYSVNTYNQNLKIGSDNSTDQKTIFSAIPDLDAISRNRIATHIVEVPFELRWRTSTPANYKFWRVYTGVHLGYMHYFKSTFKDNDDSVFKERNPEGLDRLRIGTTLTFGWNTFNFHIYYSLNSLFNNSTKVIDQQGGISVIKLGLIFYVL